MAKKPKKGEQPDGEKPNDKPAGDNASSSHPELAGATPQSDEAEAESKRAQLEREHYLEIRDKNREVSAIYAQWQESKEETAALKKELDSLWQQLHNLIARGPCDPQLPLFDKGKAEPEWRTRPLSVLGLSDSLLSKLDESSLGTLGDLKDFWDSGKYLDSLPGIGNEKAATIADAWADYARSHQEVYGMNESDPADDVKLDDEQPDDQQDGGQQAA